MPLHFFDTYTCTVKHPLPFTPDPNLVTFTGYGTVKVEKRVGIRMRGGSRCAGVGAGAVLVLTLATLTAAASAPVEAQGEPAVLGVDMNLEPYEFCAYEGSTCSCNGAARWGYTGGHAPAHTQWVRGLFTALGDLAPHTTRGVLCSPPLSSTAS